MARVPLVAALVMMAAAVPITGSTAVAAIFTSPPPPTHTISTTRASPGADVTLDVRCQRPGPGLVGLQLAVHFRDADESPADSPFDERRLPVEELPAAEGHVAVVFEVPDEAPLGSAFLDIWCLNGEGGTISSTSIPFTVIGLAATGRTSAWLAVAGVGLVTLGLGVRTVARRHTR